MNDEANNTMSDATINVMEGVHRFQHRAMATIFEIMVANEGRSYAEQAAVAVFQEIDRLEQELSRYLPNSEISRINNLKGGEAVQASLDAFACLRLSLQYWKETGGAFDVSLGALMDCWVGKNKSLLHPSPQEVERARARCGMDRLVLDESKMTVHVREGPVQIDLGAIGKGYAVDRGVELLKEWGITSALVHGGASSVLAFGDSPSGSGWPITLSSPQNPAEVLQHSPLRDQALGGSGVKKGRHIIDPRRGQPVGQRRAAWVCSDSAAGSDAISTAFMVMGQEEIDAFVKAHHGMWAVTIEEDPATGVERVFRFGVI
jgi:thiamine biosynthesis lipoprotein